VCANLIFPINYHDTGYAAKCFVAKGYKFSLYVLKISNSDDDDDDDANNNNNHHHSVLHFNMLNSAATGANYRVITMKQNLRQKYRNIRQIYVYIYDILLNSRCRTNIRL
jgi:hypothetical protein